MWDFTENYEELRECQEPYQNIHDLVAHYGLLCIKNDNIYGELWTIYHKLHGKCNKNMLIICIYYLKL